jgi:hypothetical protein
MANIAINAPSVVALLRSNISVVGSGTTLTNAFFASAINSIYSRQANRTYITGLDFTQSGTTITATTFTFAAGDTIIAYL